MPKGVYPRTEYHRSINKGRVRNKEMRIKLRLVNLGKKRSEEIRKKISLAQMGRKPSLETRRKIGLANSIFLKGNTPWNKGLTENDPRVAKNIKAFYRSQAGKRLTYKRRRQLSEINKKRVLEGKHNFYIDGRTKIKYDDWLLDTVEWRVWRDKVFRRDSYICQWCGVEGGRLEPHHIKKKSKYPRLVFVLNNGITLCHSCHNLTKGKEEKFEQLFVQILNKGMAYLREGLG